MQENAKKIHQISESNQDNFSRIYSKDLIRSDPFGSDRKKGIQRPLVNPDKIMWPKIESGLIFPD
jgi:hypothetical protein